MEFTNILVAIATAVPINRPTVIIRITSFQGLIRLSTALRKVMGIYEIIRILICMTYMRS